jgi:hypothetical protein
LFPNALLTRAFVYGPKYVSEGDLATSLAHDGEGVPVLVFIVSNSRFTLTDPNARVLTTKVTHNVSVIVTSNPTNLVLRFVSIRQSIQHHVMHQLLHEQVVLFVRAKTLLKPNFFDIHHWEGDIVSHLIVPVFGNMVVFVT